MSALLAPLLLARSVAVVVALTTTAKASLVTLDVLRRGEDDLSARSARRIELAASAVEVGLVAEILSLLLLIVAADRLAPSLEGAMCAYGVFSSTPWGPFALGTALVASLASAAWLALHRVDLAARAPSLTMPKLAGLALVLPLVALDVAGHFAFAATLDLSTQVSCCTTTFDPATASPFFDLSGRSRLLLALASLVLSAIAIALSALPRMSTASLLTRGLVGTVASVLSAACVVFVVAPHVYETPVHTCPFCLFSAAGHHLGWPLFVAWWAGLAGALASLVLARVHAGRQIAPDTTRVLRTLGHVTMVALAANLLLSALPVLRYVLLTGTWLFGQ